MEDWSGGFRGGCARGEVPDEGRQQADARLVRRVLELALETTNQM